MSLVFRQLHYLTWSANINYPLFFLYVEYISKVIKASSYSLSFCIILSYIRKFCSTLNFLKIVLEKNAETNLFLKA